MATQKKELQFRGASVKLPIGKQNLCIVCCTQTYCITLLHTEGATTGLSPQLCPRGTAALFLAAPGAVAPLFSNG